MISKEDFTKRGKYQIIVKMASESFSGNGKKEIICKVDYINMDRIFVVNGVEYDDIDEAIKIYNESRLV